MGRRRFGVTLLSTPECYLFSEKEIKAVYYNLIKFIKYKYRNSDYDYSILVGLSNVDGKSAKDMKGRPEFQKMINDLCNGVIDTICIYKLDRLTRSIKDLEEILVLLEEKNCICIYA